MDGKVRQVTVKLWEIAKTHPHRSSDDKGNVMRNEEELYKYNLLA